MTIDKVLFEQELKMADDIFAVVFERGAIAVMRCLHKQATKIAEAKQIPVSDVTLSEVIAGVEADEDEEAMP
jgi:hypothetical protein